MSSKKGSSKKRGKSKKSRVSVRDQMRKNKSRGGDDSEKSSDPIGSLDAEWWKNAKEADKWKPKWECMQSLMGFASGDQWGKGALPEKFDDNKKALEVITIFSKWLMDEQHIFTRQHILKLLIPFSNSYSKQSWRKANKIAEAIMTKQWTEKKHGFLPLVTPALIAVYIASGSSLKKWKEYLIQSMDSPQGQVRMSCWDFMSKICILSTTHNKLKKQGQRDIEQFINDKQIIEYLKNTIINDKEKEVRDSCAKFIYGAKQICKKLNVLDSAYKQILKDKRASTALDMASDLYSMDKKILSGDKVSNDQIAKKAEKIQQKKKKKQASSRKNNMRAMIAQARKQAAKTGGGGAIEIAAVGGGGGGVGGNDDKASSDDESDKNDTPPPPPKTKKNKSRKNDKKSNRGGGMKALMNKYKKDSVKKRKPETPKSPETPMDDGENSDDDDDNDNESDDDDKSDDSDKTDSEEERERERLKKRQQRERDREKKRKEREKEREKQRKQKEDDKKRREREREKSRKEKEKKNKRKKSRYSSSSSSAQDDDDDVSDKNDSDNSDLSDNDSYNNNKRRKRRGRVAPKRRHNNNKRDKKHISESRTETIDDTTIGASSSDIQELSEKVDSISKNVQSLQSGMKGMERKMSDIAKNTESKSGMSSKTEEKIMKILAQLQKDVKIMKNDISYIKACWEDAESVPSDGNY